MLLIKIFVIYKALIVFAHIHCVSKTSATDTDFWQAIPLIVVTSLDMVC